MTTVGGTVPPAGRDVNVVSAREWEGLCRGLHSVLVEGPDDSTDDLVRRLEPHLRQPVIWRQLPGPLESPLRQSGTLVLRNVGELSQAAQDDVLRWLDDPAGAKQVVSTTARPLFPLVQRGLFDAVLYYRLNVIRLRLGPGEAPGSLSRG